MPYYNVIQAAKYIGCDPKTVRRMLKRGELTGERTERGWLAIPGGQVEYAKIRWEEEQAKFARPWLSRESLVDTPDASLGSLSNESLDRIRQLEDRIGHLEETVLAQNERIVSLEQALSNASLVVPGQSIPPSPTSDLIPQTKPQKRNVDANSPISDGWVLCSDFFKQYEISETSWRRWIKNGLSGDRFECEESLLPDGKIGRYFNEEQQEKAIELLRKHGKLDTN